ncbi:MAG: glycerol dehydrogenase [Actinobacteria bacterium]|nr:glycerol dehydrogenase [Actinomycetota bacterium]
MLKIKTCTRAMIAPSKYYQGPGELNRLENYTSKFGTSVLIIGGKTFFEKFEERLLNGYKQTSSTISFVKFDTKKCEVSLNQISKIVKQCSDKKYDSVVGIGGGKVLDMAKAVANKLESALIIFPTSASSDAPTSSFSVIYTDEGVYSHLLYCKKNPDIVLIDSEIIAKAPVRLLVAGIGDALSTYIEVRASMEAGAPNLIEDGYKRTLTGIAIAKLCHKTILKEGLKAKIAAEAGVCTEALENIIEANTLMSGMGFECNGASGAHGFHDGFTILEECKKYLHGEIVSFGIICQLVLENRDLKEIEEIINFLTKVGLPTTLKDIGIEKIREDDIRKVAKQMVNSFHMQCEPFMVTENMIYDAIIAANAIGEFYKEKH